MIKFKGDPQLLQYQEPVGQMMCLKHREISQITPHFQSLIRLCTQRLQNYL